MSQQQHTKKPTYLDSLPVELKLMLLFRLHDHGSLRNLFLVSPAYGAVYERNVQEVLTSITINQLRGRGLDFFHPPDVLEVSSGRDGGSHHQLDRAIQTLLADCRHYNGGKLNCSVGLCKLLLEIVHVIGWRVVIEAGVVTGVVPCAEERRVCYAFGYSRYHTLFLDGGKGAKCPARMEGVVRDLIWCQAVQNTSLEGLERGLRNEYWNER